MDKKGVEEKGVEKGLDQSVREAVDSKKEEEGRAVEVKNGVGREGGGGSDRVRSFGSSYPVPPFLLPPSTSLAVCQRLVSSAKFGRVDLVKHLPRSPSKD